ncbi:hypothetical protein MCOR25_005369 [Pyricularia grisea]|nr:hypothetical protein MCOR25_005369 [Pyricularia grisea]
MDQLIISIDSERLSIPPDRHGPPWIGSVGSFLMRVCHKARSHLVPDSPGLQPSAIPPPTCASAATALC